MPELPRQGLVEAYLLAIVSPSGFRIATVRMESSYQLSSKNAPGILRATVHVVYSAVRIHPLVNLGVGSDIRRGYRARPYAPALRCRIGPWPRIVVIVG